jgi:predicted RecB family nuclease
MPESIVPYVRATDLYELASCPHRIALDRRLARLQRSEPDEATRLLLAHGRALEERIAHTLGFVQPEYDAGDFVEGARQTERLMRSGVPGIYQAVLIRGRYLAIPDLLERRDGASGPASGGAPAPGRDGGFSYVPGDIKTGVTPRSDQVLQVAFAGWLLGQVQGHRPDEGFLILGDGTREDFSLREIDRVLDAARERVCEIADELAGTRAFFDAACGHCRWSGTCLPELAAARDLSLVDGMTATRREVLLREGVATVEALAALDVAAWKSRGLPSLALDQLVQQAAALASGAVRVLREVELPPAGPALFVFLERDPLDGGRASLLAWGRPGEVAAEILLGDDERVRALARFADAALAPGVRAYHFGAPVPRGLADLAALAALEPDRQVALENRLFDLAPSLRRGTAYLPVRRYTLDEIGAVLAGRPLPGPADTGTPAFVLAEHLRRDTPGPWRERLRAYAADRVERLEQLHAFLRAQPTRPPRRGRA